MKLITTLLLITLLTLSCSMIIPHLGKLKGHVPRTYKVQESDPAEVRWAPMLHDYKHFLALFMAEFQLLPIPQKFYDMVDWYAHNVFTHKDFVTEIEAVAKLSGYPFGQLFFINFMYEFSTFKSCSAILVATANGKVLHGRNLDFPMMRLLAPLVVSIQYYAGQKHLYTMDSVIGSVFTLTAIKPGAFAVNVDTRYADRFVDDFISVLINDAIPDCWLLRNVLKDETNFDDAVERLKTTRVAGPVYYIISGAKPYQGAVIERDTNGVHGFYTLNKTNWFLVQTNYDRDQPDPKIDPRRGAVENRLRERGSAGFDQKVLYDDYMTLWPSMNIGTIMTAIMTPSTGYHTANVFYKANPSEPQSG